MKNLVVCYPTEDKHLRKLSESAPGYRIVTATQDTIKDLIFEADIFVGHAKVPIDWDGVVARGRLTFIQSSAAGLDHCLARSVIDSSIVVCSASGLFADQVAEQSLALLLGLLRGIPIFYRQQQRHAFVRQPTDDLHGKRVGIVGLGGNGRRLAQVLAPFRVAIRATDYFPEQRPDGVEALWPHTDLHKLAAWSEILILSLPLNEQTRGLIDRSVFETMERGGYLINLARGQCVNEHDMIEVLASGHLRGAGLDVTATEPLPPESPLYDMPQVLITPHVGAQSGPRYDDSTRLICENLRRHLQGQPLYNIVDKTLGFPHPSVLYFPTASTA
ncbi:MAG: D-2-hydroxyacid dehydrogenase [Planctomycetota bacterium]|jgi:D-3-phosphoglycerate dehydrogenase